MKKLTRKSLDELAKTLPVIEEASQMHYVGGGDGSPNNPYTAHEYVMMLINNKWEGGYVEGCGYILPSVTVTSYNPNNLCTSGVDSYDQMYRSGYDTGFKAGVSPGIADDIAVGAWSMLSAASAGSEFGDVNYNMTWYSQGLRDGLSAGIRSRSR